MGFLHLWLTIFSVAVVTVHVSFADTVYEALGRQADLSKIILVVFASCGLIQQFFRYILLPSRSDGKTHICKSSVRWKKEVGDKSICEENFGNINISASTLFSKEFSRTERGGGILENWRIRKLREKKWNLLSGEYSERGKLYEFDF
ncbi:unnamed protein product [Larinioides sclopetarius]|uniref:Uncharacterized protein n=1 Tax=Larinioides sclopetarius TaxID=280406 RepID=A0AAV1ZXD3_9ARAC